MKYTVVRIDEDIDFGCEERAADDPVMAVVTLKTEDGEEVRMRQPDQVLYARDINEGDVVILNEKQELQKPLNEEGDTRMREENDNIKVVDHVISAYNEELIKAVNDKYDGYADLKVSGCTSKIVPGVGLCKNNDLTQVSDHTLYIMAGATGKYHTLSTIYSDTLSGLPEEDAINRAYMFASEIVNNAGENGYDQNLCIAEQMRNHEDVNYNSSMVGSNPDAEERMCIIFFARMCADTCATYDDVMALVQRYNWFSPYSETMNWNFSYTISTADGRHFILETVDNKWVVTEDTIQANFYLAKDYQYPVSIYGSGFGRYDFLKAQPDFTDAESALDQLQEVRFSLAYDPDCEWDPASEYVHLDGYDQSWSVIADVIKNGSGSKYASYYPELAGLDVQGNEAAVLTAIDELLPYLKNGMTYSDSTLESKEHTEMVKAYQNLYQTMTTAQIEGTQMFWITGETTFLDAKTFSLSTRAFEGKTTYRYVRDDFRKTCDF